MYRSFTQFDTQGCLCVCPTIHSGEQVSGFLCFCEWIERRMFLLSLVSRKFVLRPQQQLTCQMTVIPHHYPSSLDTFISQQPTCAKTHTCDTPEASLFCTPWDQNQHAHKAQLCGPTTLYSVHSERDRPCRDFLQVNLKWHSSRRRTDSYSERVFRKMHLSFRMHLPKRINDSETVLMTQTMGQETSYSRNQNSVHQWSGLTHRDAHFSMTWRICHLRTRSAFFGAGDKRHRWKHATTEQMVCFEN